MFSTLLNESSYVLQTKFCESLSTHFKWEMHTKNNINQDSARTCLDFKKKILFLSFSFWSWMWHAPVIISSCSIVLHASIWALSTFWFVSFSNHNLFDSCVVNFTQYISQNLNQCIPMSAKPAMPKLCAYGIWVHSYSAIFLTEALSFHTSFNVTTMTLEGARSSEWSRVNWRWNIPVVIEKYGVNAIIYLAAMLEQFFRLTCSISEAQTLC